jgi:carbonic anhydrase
MPVDIKSEEAHTSQQAPLKWAITDGPATPNIFYNGHAVQVQDFNTVALLNYKGANLSRASYWI